MNSPDRQGHPPLAAALRRPATTAESISAARTHWDRDAAAYIAEHLASLGVSRLQWGPEGLDEEEARLLGDVEGQTVLELGCGAAHGARWLQAQGATVIALDLSVGMLHEAHTLDAAAGTRTRLVQGAAERLPLAAGQFDLVVSAFGALPFVRDTERAFDEVARVLRPGGRCVVSVMHPVRWMFPDDPDAGSLHVVTSYFDRTPYVEEDSSGAAVYAEHHRTIGDWVRAIRGSGLLLDDIIEPEWPEGRTERWGAWSPERGALIPGTAILVAHRPSA